MVIWPVIVAKSFKRSSLPKSIALVARTRIRTTQGSGETERQIVWGKGKEETESKAKPWGR